MAETRKYSTFVRDSDTYPVSRLTSVIRQFFVSRYKSFCYAFSGWWYVIHTQKNTWIHSLATILVVLLSFWLQISTNQWAIIILAIALVWMAEFINTALEAVVDLASPEKHPLAKVGKDVGAAAVLIGALSSILIGLFVLGPALVNKLEPLIQYFSKR